MPLLEHAQPKQVWMGDRHFCTHVILQRLNHAGTGFVVREQHIDLALESNGQEGQSGTSWRRIEIQLGEPTEPVNYAIGLWSKLPASIDAATIARLHRKRWRIEGMFQRLESVPHSEIKSLGHPRAAF